MTYFISLIYNILFFAIIFVVYLYVTKRTTLKFEHARQKKFVWLLMFTHCLFSTAFYFYSTNASSDAYAYYELALNANDWFSLFGMGAFFMKFITYPFISLQLSYFNINLIFSFFGLIGFYNLYFLLIQKAHTDNSRISWGANILLLLPTFHFYTSGISKDNLMFFSITTLLTYILLNKKKYWKYCLLLVFIFYVRSHILIFLFVGFGIYLFFLSKIKTTVRLSVILFLVSALFFIEPIISSKLKIDIFSLESLNTFLERVQSFGKREVFGGSIIDSSEMSILQRMFTFSYLPLIWKSNSILKHLTSIENFFLLLTFIRFLFSKGKFKLFTKTDFLIKISLLYSFVAWFMLSFTLYNLGLSTRQKYLYIPYLYLVIFVHLKSRRDLKASKITHKQIN